MTDTASPALEAARMELFRLGVMTPGDLLEETSPAAALLFAFDTARAVIAVLGGAVGAAGEADTEATEILSRALNGASAALAGYTHSLVELRVLPTEAEEAITAGMPQLFDPDGPQ